MSRVSEAFFLRPWAITEDMLQIISGIVDRHLRGEKLTEDEIAAKIGDSKKKSASDLTVIGGTAIIPVYGVISKRMTWMSAISGGTSVQLLRSNLRAALDDKSVKRILLDVDSPGGSANGIAEAAETIREVNGIKPVTAYANGTMASAAYWIGAAAGSIVASKDAAVGSIGVYAVLRDWSVYEHNAGVKTSIIKAGRYKAAGHPSKPMTEEDKAVIQEEVDDIYALFTEAVGAYRGMGEEQLAKVATGRVFIAKKAQKLGLIDGIGTFDGVLGALSDSGKKSMITADDPEGDKHITVIPSEQEEEPMSKEMSAEKLKSEHSDVYDAVFAEGRAAGVEEGKEAGIAEGKTAGIEEGRAEGRAEAVKETEAAEQKRVDAICAAMPKGMEAVALQAVKEGKSEAEAKDMFLVAIKNAGPENPGANADPNAADPDNAPPAEPKTLEQECKENWEKDPDLRAQFSSVETYTGYTRAQRRGSIRGGK